MIERGKDVFSVVNMLGSKMCIVKKENILRKLFTINQHTSN